jgi:hypothetical protein
MNTQCSRQGADGAGCEVVSWKPILLKAIVAHPLQRDFTVRAIDGMCIATLSCSNPGPATTMTDHSPWDGLPGRVSGVDQQPNDDVLTVEATLEIFL